MRYHHKSTRIAAISNTDNTKYWQRYRTKGTLKYCLGAVKFADYKGILFGNHLLKLHLDILYDPELSLQALTVIRNICTIRPVQEWPQWHNS